MTQVKKKMPECLLAGLIAVIVAFAIGAFAAQDAYAEGLDEGVLFVGGYDIVVEGGTVTGDDGQGTAVLTYDDDGNPVLTLDNYKCENCTGGSSKTYNAVIHYRGSTPFTIQMSGTNVVKAASGSYVHNGIFSKGPLVIKGDGSLSASGVRRENYANHGIICSEDIQIESGRVTATGGDTQESSGSSYGIRADNIIKITGGTVNASGGNAGGDSYGIAGGNGVEITGGNVKAIAGSAGNNYSYGIWGGATTTIDIGSGVTRVESAGANRALVGIIKNAIPGTGWDSTDGTGDGTLIPDNQSGASLYYKKVVFEPTLDVRIKGNTSNVKYNGKEQFATGFTAEYKVSDGGWTAKAPDGVSVNLKEGVVAEAKGTNVNTYEMGLTADSFDINPGNYKPGEVNVTDGSLTIGRAPLTITAKDQTLTYNGKTQGPGDAAYEDPAEIAEKVTVEGLQGSDKLTKIEVDGQGKEVGEYDLIPNAAAVGNATANYDIKYVNGKLTITKAKPKPTPPQPKPDPKPQPKVNKTAAKTALDAGVIAKSSGSKVTASWGAVKGASSYVIYANYCDQKKCKKIKTVSGKTTSFDITKLNGKKFNPKKNLKFYVVAYQKVNGKNVKLSESIMAHAPGSKNSKRTNVTGVKVKKASFTLKKNKTAKIKAKLVLQKKGKKPLKHEAKFRYATSNAEVAKVSKKGKITAVGKGTCTVYVYAVSGVSKKIKVTVK